MSGEQLTDAVTRVWGRPRVEGANIRTWIGFKHFMYLAEEAVLQHLRGRGVGPHRLYHEHGLGLAVVDSSVVLPAVLDIDDEVVADVRCQRRGGFAVKLRVERDGSEVVVLKGKLTVAVITEEHRSRSGPPLVDLPAAVTDSAATTPAWDRRDVAMPPSGDARQALCGWDPQALLWSWRVPYFYCQYSHRVQHSGYVRALEEVVDRFLSDRGISVRHMLDERGWIPVVSRARVRILADAHMEETVHTTFRMSEILKGVSFEGRMDCHVERDGNLVHTATAMIVHAYAISRGEDAGRLAVLDASTVSALTGGGAT